MILNSSIEVFLAIVLAQFACYSSNVPGECEFRRFYYKRRHDCQSPDNKLHSRMFTKILFLKNNVVTNVVDVDGDRVQFVPTFDITGLKVYVVLIGQQDHYLDQYVYTQAEPALDYIRNYFNIIEEPVPFESNKVFVDDTLHFNIQDFLLDCTMVAPLSLWTRKIDWLKVPLSGITIISATNFRIVAYNPTVGDYIPPIIELADPDE